MRMGRPARRVVLEALELLAFVLETLLSLADLLALVLPAPPARARLQCTLKMDARAPLPM